MKKTAILVLCAAMIMAFAAWAVSADEPVVRGFVYDEAKTVFNYLNAEATAVSVKLYAAAVDGEPLGTYPMTKGENGIWSAAVEGDQQQRYYTFTYTVGEESFEIADPTNAAPEQTRSYIPALAKYALWVAGIQVTNFNAGDILGDKDEGAVVRYDPATNTLSFAPGTSIVTGDVGISYTGTETLNIKLEGDTRITSALGALRSDASVTVTADEPSVFYAVTTGDGVGVHIGANGVLKLEGRAFLHTTSQKLAGLYLTLGATVQLGEKNVLITMGAGAANDIQAEDENFAIPMDWITTGKLIPVTGRPGVKATIGDDPVPYTYVGCPGDQYGIGIHSATADHSFWLTQSTRETGFGYVAYTKTEEARKAVLFNTKLNSLYGAALSFAEPTEIVLRGKNVLTGTTTGLEVTTATLTGHHGKLVANGIKITESLLVKEGALELDSDKPLFGDVLPDLSQYNGEYTLVTETEKPAPPETPVTPPEGGEGGEVVTPPEGGEGGEVITPPEGGEGGEVVTPPEGGTEGSSSEEESENPEGTGPEGTAPEGSTPEGTEPAPEEKKPYLTYKLTPKQTHTMDPWVEGSKPTCVTDGVAGHQRCTVCQLYVDAEGNELPAIYLPVAYDSHDFISHAPLEEKDVHLSTCSRNPAHVFTTPCFGGAEICLERRVCEGCGVKHGDRLFHIFDDNYTETSEMGHWSLCQRPGCGAPDEPKAHSGGFVGCDKAYVCEICGHEYGGVAGHSYTTKASDRLVSEATCALPAQYLIQCDHCDTVHETQTVSVGEKLTHSYQEEWSTNNAGHWHICAVCGGISQPERHVEIVVGQKHAAEEVPGYTGDIYCQVCNALIFKGSETPALPPKDTSIDPMVIVAIAALAVSGLGFGGVIIFGAVKKKRAEK